MKSSLSEEEQKMIGNIELYVPYLVSDLRFDNLNTRKEFPATVPKVRSYFRKMAEYIKSTANPWIKNMSCLPLGAKVALTGHWLVQKKRISRR